jgi:hypothetical protein
VRRQALPAGAWLVLVRGSDNDFRTDRHQAEAFQRRYPDWGRCGLSAFYAESEAGIDDLAADRLERFPVLRVYRAEALSDPASKWCQRSGLRT